MHVYTLKDRTRMGIKQKLGGRVCLWKEKDTEDTKNFSVSPRFYFLKELKQIYQDLNINFF